MHTQDCAPVELPVLQLLSLLALCCWLYSVLYGCLVPHPGSRLEAGARVALVCPGLACVGVCSLMASETEAVRWQAVDIAALPATWVLASTLVERVCQHLQLHC